MKRIQQLTVEAWRIGTATLERYCRSPGPAHLLLKHIHQEYQFYLASGHEGAYSLRQIKLTYPKNSLVIIRPDELHGPTTREFAVPVEFCMMGRPKQVRIE